LKIIELCSRLVAESIVTLDSEFVPVEGTIIGELEEN